ncbi:MAG: hypothetical protein ACYTAF_02910, partial [Planctomycetota bacterium]
EGTAWILGSEEFEGRRYPAVALVVPVADGPAAAESLREIMYLVLSDDEKDWVHKWSHGHRLIYFRVPAVWKEEPLARFCFTENGNALIAGNNPEFLTRVMDAANGAVYSLRDTRDPDRAIDEDAVLNLFVAFGSLYDSSEGLARVIADKMMDNDEERNKVIAEMKREGKTQDEIDRTYYTRRMIPRIEAKAVEIRKSFKAFLHLRWLKLRAKFVGGELEVRAVLRLR